MSKHQQTTNDQLLAYLFDDKPHPLSASMNRWIDSSRRYKEFVAEYQNKIRKKIRITQSDSAIQDLTAELETAYQLVRQKRFTVDYEPYGSQNTRGPDFAVTFKSLTFNVEVTRIDSSNMEMSGTPPGFDPQQVGLRFTDTVCDKLGQMRPGMSNILIVATDSDFFTALDIEQAMAHLKDGAERKEEMLYGRYGYVKPADFFKYYLRLSGTLVRTTGNLNEAVQSLLWTNNQTKHPLPTPLQKILQRAHKYG